MEIFSIPEEWVLLFSVQHKCYIQCPCGHRVKHITYVYHKPTKKIRFIGKSCARKYGIHISATNPYLLDVIKKGLMVKWEIDRWIHERIETEYTTFMTRIRGGNVEPMVRPFRQFLGDVCELVSEYGFDLADLLQGIEREVEALNEITHHLVVEDDSLYDSLSEISMEQEVEFEDPLENVILSEDIPMDLQESVEEPAEESFEDPAEDPDEDPAEESFEDPAEEPVEESFEDPAEEPVEEEVKEEVKEAVEEVVKEVVKETVEEEVEPSAHIHEVIPVGTISYQDTSHPLITEIPHTDGYHNGTFCYCEMKYRIKRMTEDVASLRESLQKSCDESIVMLHQTQTMRKDIQSYLEKYSNYTVKIEEKKNKTEE